MKTKKEIKEKIQKSSNNKRIIRIIEIDTIPTRRRIANTHDKNKLLTSIEKEESQVSYINNKINFFSNKFSLI